MLKVVSYLRKESGLETHAMLYGIMMAVEIVMPEFTSQSQY
jgi:hypothetical protein